MASLPDFLLRDKKHFLDMMAAPRPFTELKNGAISSHSADHGTTRSISARNAARRVVLA